MRVLVYPHSMEVGGSQLNAIQIAAAVRRAGHEVIVYGQPGPLVRTVNDYGLEFLTAPVPSRRPSPAVTSHLRTVVRSRGIDVVHGYEWPPALEAHAATRGLDAVAVGTIMSMAVAPFLPRSLHLAVGTEQIAEAERLAGRTNVSVIEPPVDLELDGMDMPVDLSSFRDKWGLVPEVPTVAIVTRLAAQLKLEGILTAIQAVGEIGRRRPVRLLIVGDGPARDRVAGLAEQVNRKTGEATIILTGELADPRPAYAAADIALGMGGSALRSMAFGKPLIVQGEAGFWKLLTPETLDQFLWTGWYGHGVAGADGVEALRAPLEVLLDDHALRADLGSFARTVVVERFSLATVAERQVSIYEAAAGKSAGLAADSVEVGRSTGLWIRYQVRKRLSRALGADATDDFNVRPLARDVEPAATATRADGGAVLYFAGVSWDSVPGTDKQLVRALVRHRPVIWVDPPTSWLAWLRRKDEPARVSQLGANLIRVHPSSPPGVTRPLVRAVAVSKARREALKAARDWGRGLSGIVVSSPEQLIPDRVLPHVARVYYETDDFVAGAALFGISEKRIRRQRRINVERSSVVLAVTEGLAMHLGGGTKPWSTLPNGCDTSAYAGTDRLHRAPEVWLPSPVAGIVGQLNERLDLGLLEGLAEAGISLLIVGPRHRLRAADEPRLDALFARENVQWVDRQPLDRLPMYLACMDVGLTPYLDTAFNRASFPLKTMEYLAAGLAVVSTDLPAAHVLDTDLVEIASNPEDFIKATLRLLEVVTDPVVSARRRALAESHSWTVRSAQLLDAMELGRPHASSSRPERGKPCKKV